MRSFFRSYVGDIGRLLRKVADVVNAAAKSPSGNVNALLPEANKIVVVCVVLYLVHRLANFYQIVLHSASRYRSHNQTIYGIQLPMISPWTSKPSVIDTVLSLFDFSTKAAEPSLGQSVPAKNKEPRSQLPALATVLFESIKERLDWLSRFVSIMTLLILLIKSVHFTAQGRKMNAI